MASKGWRGYTSYGGSALGIDFQLKGLDEMLKKIEKAGNNVDNAVAKAITQAAPIPLKTMQEGALRHKKTGDVVKAIQTGHIEREGNYTAIQIGIDIKKNPEAIHAVFQEYGDGHSPNFPDPFVRPAFDENTTKIRSIMRRVLKSEGVPID